MRRTNDSPSSVNDGPEQLGGLGIAAHGVAQEPGCTFGIYQVYVEDPAAGFLQTAEAVRQGIVFR